MRRIVLAVIAVSVLLTGCLNAETPLQVTPTLQNGTAAPGLWRALGGAHCYWTQNGSYKGDWHFGAAIAFHQVRNGPTYVQILPGAASFTAYDCGTFWFVPSSFDRPLATPGEPFGPGDFRVGNEIAPGTYTATPAPDPDGEGCSWERLAGFSFLLNDIIESGRTFSAEMAPQTVTIQPIDAGFSSDGCGTWTKVG